MNSPICDFRIWRINLPAGRNIGDCMCCYSSFTVVVLDLVNTLCQHGWGFGVKVADGIFKREAPWCVAVPPLSQLRLEFEQVYWPRVKGMSAARLINDKERIPANKDYFLQAVKGATWDLFGKENDLPLCRILSDSMKHRIPAYASFLGFSQTEESVHEWYRKAVTNGMRAVKVKVGHEDPEWDIRRLQVVRDATQGIAEIAVDANTAWDARQAIERIELYRSAGIDIAYVEDPLPIDDVDGYAMLGRELPIDVVGHDYISDPSDLVPLLDSGGLQRLRAHTSVDYALKISDVAEEYGLPIIVGNTFCEIGVHAAAALARVERIEYSDLAWNALIDQPVLVKEGYMYAPDCPGAGLNPKLHMLDQLNCSPKVSAFGAGGL